MSKVGVKFSRCWHRSLSDYVTALAWSADGAWLAAASAAGEVGLYRPPTDSVMLRSPDGQAINALGFSPDGRMLAAAGQAGRLIQWDLRSDSVPSPSQGAVLTPADRGVWIDQLAWHPHQPYLAWGVGPRVQIWDIPGHRPLAELDFGDSSVLHLAWHPQGDRLAASGHGGVKVWAMGDWTRPPELIAVPGASLHCAWSADGRYLGSGNLDRTLTVVDWNHPPPWLMQGFPGKVRQVAWSMPVTASGSPLVAAACADGVTVWERGQNPDDGWTSRVLQYHQKRVNAIAFQPQSLLLAAAGEDGRVTLWSQGKTLIQSFKCPSGGATLAWSSTGDRLAVASTSGDLGIWQQPIGAKGFGSAGSGS